MEDEPAERENRQPHQGFHGHAIQGAIGRAPWKEEEGGEPLEHRMHDEDHVPPLNTYSNP